MRRPVPPAASDPTSRKIRDAVRDIMGWFDAGTRTQDLPNLSVSDSDLIELVKSDGTRYAVPVTDLPGSGTTPSAGTDNPYIRKPSVWNGWDDEFDTPEVDLALRGWVIKTVATGTTLTRGGNLTPWSFPTGGTYNSEIIGSWLFLQVPEQVSIARAVTLSDGDTYWMRGGGQYLHNSSTVGRFHDVGFYGTAGSGGIDNGNRVFMSVSETSTGMQTEALSIGPLGSSNHNRGFVYPSDIRGIRRAAGPGYARFLTDSSTGMTHIDSIAQLTGQSVNQFAIVLTPGSPADALPQIFSFDFIRKSVNDAWILSR